MKRTADDKNKGKTSNGNDTTVANNNNTNHTTTNNNNNAEVQYDEDGDPMLTAEERRIIQEDKMLVNKPKWCQILMAGGEHRTSFKFMRQAMNRMDHICTVMCPTLVELFLDDMPIETCPPEIALMKKLTKLTLHMTRIKRIPDEIGELSELLVLNLDRNPFLRTIAPGIGRLQKLKMLTTSHCPKLTLPLALIQCDSLEDIDKLGDNIDALDPRLSLIPNLKNLGISEDGVPNEAQTLRNKRILLERVAILVGLTLGRVQIPPSIVDAAIAFFRIHK
jgi:Leucine-rich repeat (LRR) protein